MMRNAGGHTGHQAVEMHGCVGNAHSCRATPGRHRAMRDQVEDCGAELAVVPQFEFAP